MKFATILLTIILLTTTPDQADAQNWAYWNYGPGYGYNTSAWAAPTQNPYYYYRPDQYGPYGGGNYRPGWTNYRVPDTSWGYRTRWPTAAELGIRGQRLGDPNPRSIYR